MLKARYAPAHDLISGDRFRLPTGRPVLVSRARPDVLVYRGRSFPVVRVIGVDLRTDRLVRTTVPDTEVIVVR